MSPPAITWRGRLIAILIGFLLLMLVSEGMLRFTMPHWREFYSGRFMIVTSVPNHGTLALGRPGFDGYFAQNNGDFRVHLALNAFGLRNSEPLADANGRVWALGDSMTFGWGVERDEIYESVAGRLASEPTYNVASPGTDVCGYQALLARMPQQVRPKAVVVGLVLENDVADYDCATRARAQANTPAKSNESPGLELSLLGLKKALTENLALYNFFAVSLKRVDFLNRMLTAAGFVSQPHMPGHQIEAAPLATMAEKTAFELGNLKGMLDQSTPFAVLVMPSRFEIRDANPSHRELRQAVLTALAAHNIKAIDVSAGFAATGFSDTHFLHDGHWNPRGHRIAGEAVAAWLRASDRAEIKP